MMSKISFTYHRIINFLFLPVLLLGCQIEQGKAFSVTFENRTDKSIYLCESTNDKSCIEIKAGDFDAFDFPFDSAREDWPTRLKGKYIRMCDRLLSIPSFVLIVPPQAKGRHYQVIIDGAAYKKICS